jgi:predicted dienelactone hydrolase
VQRAGTRQRAAAPVGAWVAGLALALAVAGLAHAGVALERPQADGPLSTRTIEFADLADAARGGRRVPIKVHLPSWTGSFPVVVLSHGAGGHWDANFAQARHLASHGYVVLALEHVGSNTERMRRGMRFAANLRSMTRDADEVLGRPALRSTRRHAGTRAMPSSPACSTCSASP